MATCFGGHIIRKTPELQIDERKIEPCLGFFRLQYGALLSNATLPVTVLAGGQDRVIESAQWWQQGFFGRTANVTSTFAILPEDSVTPSWITPMDTCPKWQYAYGNNVSA